MRFPEADVFRKLPQRLMLLYAKYFARTYSHVGHVFQDRFKSLPVKDDSYLLECGRYIERNPLRANLVNRLEDYPWSSYRYYTENKRDELLSRNPLFPSLAETSALRQQRYRDYVVTGHPYEKVMMRGLFGKNLVE
jgi:putative transposase